MHKNCVQNIREYVLENEAYHLGLLREALSISFSDLPAFQTWVANQMEMCGLRVEEFIVDSRELEHQIACQQTLRNDPSALQQGPNIIGLPTSFEPMKGVLVFAHADKAPETFLWGRETPGLREHNGRLYGPGIADDVSGVTAMLSAVHSLISFGSDILPTILCASHLGKQLSVYGTYGLMSRYGPLPNALYIHPAESGAGLREIHLASNGMLEFRIEIEGAPPTTMDPFHTIYGKGALNAAEAAVHVGNKLQEWAVQASEQYTHARLEEEVGQSVGLLLSRISTDNDGENYQVPQRCILEGTVCFAPTTTLEVICGEFQEALNFAVDSHPTLTTHRIQSEWGDHMGEAVESDASSLLVRSAQKVIHDLTGREPVLTYAYSLSDIRYPIQHWNADAIGIGPRCGNLGTMDEWIDRTEYLETIVAVAGILRELSQPN